MWNFVPTSRKIPKSVNFPHFFWKGPKFTVSWIFIKVYAIFSNFFTSYLLVTLRQKFRPPTSHTLETSNFWPSEGAQNLKKVHFWEAKMHFQEGSRKCLFLFLPYHNIIWEGKVNLITFWKISQPYCTYICKVLSNIDLKLLKISAIPIFKKTSSAGCWWQRFMGLKYFVKDSANKILGIKKNLSKYCSKTREKKI